MIDRHSLSDSISTLLSPRHGEVARLLTVGDDQTAPLTFMEAGRVLALVLSELPVVSAQTRIDQLELAGADLAVHGRNVWLTPEEARHHPAFQGWAGDNFAAQLGIAMNAGATLTAASIAAPVFGGAALIQVGDHLVCGIADLEFPQTGAGATLHFGNRWQGAPHRVTREVSSSALLGIGIASRETRSVVLPVEPADVSGSQSRAVH